MLGVVLSVSLVVWVGAYLYYLWRNYPGDPERPPFFSVVTLVFLLVFGTLLSANLLMPWEGTPGASIGSIVHDSVPFYILSGVGVLVDAAIQRRRR